MRSKDTRAVAKLTVHKGESEAQTYQKGELAPRLRFPGFRNAGGWDLKPLNDFASLITERVGDRAITPLSITSGVGLVTQEEKYGRSIAGQQLRNYFVLRNGDFAYNKSATKECPQGFIASYSGKELAAVPNSIFTCFRVSEETLSPRFLGYLFDTNLHGKWLSNFLTVGARAHGSLNIDNKDLLSLPVPVPFGAFSFKEQQKLADCLSSIDELIGAETRKLGALKVYKKGLMQQLFPAEGETLPRRRFPEFQNAPVWKEAPLSSHIHLLSGLHLLPVNYGVTGEMPYFTGPTDFTNEGRYTTKWTQKSENAAAKGDTLITVKGSGVGQLWQLTLSRIAIGRQLMAVRAKESSNSFLYQILMTRSARFKALASGNLIPGLSRSDILNMMFYFPSVPEQKRVAACLSDIDVLIAAQSNKIATLEAHRKGLMQQLFPVLNEAQA